VGATNTPTQDSASGGHHGTEPGQLGVTDLEFLRGDDPADDLCASQRTVGWDGGGSVNRQGEAAL
jgi:hypothetical protein